MAGFIREMGLPYASEPGADDDTGLKRIAASCRWRIRKLGINAEIEIFEGLPHGFRLREGTIAEGWFDNAVQFWEDNMVE